MNEEVDLGAFVAGFVAEAEDHLRTSRAALLELDHAAEERQARPRAVRELYRSLHTLKGLAAMVGVEPLVELTHRMETVLREADQTGGAFSPPAVDALVRALELAEQRIRALSRGEQVAPAPASLLRQLEELRPIPIEAPSARGMRLRLDPALVEKLTTAERNQILDAVRAGRRAVTLTFVPTPARAEAGITITTVRERIASLGEIVRVMPIGLERSDDTPGGLAFALLVVTDGSDPQLAEALGPEGGAVEPLVDVIDEAPEEEALPAGATGAHGVVRVGVDRLERALAQLSTVIVTRHRLDRAIEELSSNGVDVRGLRQASDEHARQVRGLRESVLQLRMVPVAEMLEPIPLILRGLRSSTGKIAQLELQVARAELDKAVAESIFPTIVHLVRNAVGHGIEPPEQRRRLGKPEAGTITIRATELGTGLLEIEVSDDGAGVDAVAVARRAGVQVPEDDAALLGLLARPGVSTRSQVDHTSGRGMGMDIVRRVIVQQLGGELRLDNRPGLGATFTLRVPLTVNLVDGLSFVCGSQPFVVPLAVVDEVLDLSSERVIEAPDPRGHGAVRVIEHHGEVIPYVDLGDVLGLASPGRAEKGVLVRRSGRGVAFGVERVCGLQELVVRPLEDPLVRVLGITGSTDLGDGRATLVIDLPELASRFAGVAAQEVLR